MLRPHESTDKLLPEWRHFFSSSTTTFDLPQTFLLYVKYISSLCTSEYKHAASWIDQHVALTHEEELRDETCSPPVWLMKSEHREMDTSHVTSWIVRSDNCEPVTEKSF